MGQGRTMAQAKKEIIIFQCEVCKSHNYTIRRAIKSGQDKLARLELKKHCPKCKKHTLHKEIKAAKNK